MHNHNIGMNLVIDLSNTSKVTISFEFQVVFCLNFRLNSLN